MLENPFKPNTPIEKTSSKANRKVVSSFLGPEAGTVYAELEDNKNVPIVDVNDDVTLTNVEKKTIVEARIPTTPEAINAALIEIGSPATLDKSYEGGIVSLNIDPQIIEAFASYDTAITVYSTADDIPAMIDDELQDIPWVPLTSTCLDVLVLNHGETTTEDRDSLVKDMDELGYRPLTFSELVVLGCIRPDLNERGDLLSTYENYILTGRARSPFIGKSDSGKRMLSAGVVWGDWNQFTRHLFVRK